MENSFLKIMSSGSSHKKNKRSYVKKKFVGHTPLNILSLGVGLQSTVLYFMSFFGDIPKIDYAVFADTGNEKDSTLNYFDFLIKFQKENNSTPIIRIAEKNIITDLKAVNSSRFPSLPAFTRSSSGKVGMLKRQCTSTYKIREVIKVIRSVQNISKYKQTPPTNILLGITSDEIQRLSKPYYGWQSHVYPFVGYKISSLGTVKLDYNLSMNRTDCVSYLQSKNLPIPVKSSCKICPFQSENSWLSLKNNDIVGFSQAVEIDSLIRNSSSKGIKSPLFLNRKCIPLSEISFSDIMCVPEFDCSGYCNL